MIYSSDVTRLAIETKLTDSPTPADKREALLKDPGFGKTFSDHMVTAYYDADRGWHRAMVVPRERLSLDPSANVLHYGQSIFEGLKAYRWKDGRISAFRASDHEKRMAKSAERMAMPPLPDGFFVQSIDALLKVDVEWVPREPGQSMYLRPTMIATEPFLGVRPAKQFLYFLLASPVASYFKAGATISVYVTRDYSRAAPGGTGAAKTAGNYGSSLLAQQQAIAAGCDQVLWLDANERRYVEELGGMNIFFVKKDGGKLTLLTPPLSDTILAGVTRKSLIELAREEKHTVEERKIALDEVIEGAKSGQITEMFACGTAAVITPIAKIKSAQGEYTLKHAAESPVAMELRKRLVALQTGEAEDRFGWSHMIPL
jgi:branched-chain amino acid aminotransferase